MKKTADLFSLIKADHRKVEELFAKLDKTTERAAKTREELYGKLRTEITVHSFAEERGIYPLLKQEEATEDIGFESVEEHGIVKFLLGKLDNTPYDSKEWSARITALKEVIEHHVEEEEDEMFKKMKRTFSPEELKTMAVNFQENKSFAEVEEPQVHAA
jgi:hypothetical protein